MNKPGSPYLWCGAAVAASLLFSVSLGSEWIGLEDLGRLFFLKITFQDVPEFLRQEEVIVFQMRLPRTVLIAMVGAALGGSGAAYQGLLRNPLADPYLIGVAPGAALGGVLAIVVLGPTSALGLLTVPAAAFCGALLTVAVVYRIARIGNATPVTTLILAGVAVGSFASALTSFLMLLKEEALRPVIYFLLGGFHMGGWSPVLAGLPYEAAGLIAIVLFSRHLNILQLGDEQALQLGMNVERVKLQLAFAASLAAAAAVAFVGIIGFVGLIVPHVVRLIWGPDYRRIVPLSILGGAAALLLAGTLAASVTELRRPPLGVITALFGAPFFLYLLRREQRYYW